MIVYIRDHKIKIMNKKKLLGLTVMGTALLLLPRRSSPKPIVDSKSSSTIDKPLPVNNALENVNDFNKKYALYEKLGC